MNNYDKDFKTAITEYSNSDKFKKLLADRNVLTPGAIVLTDKTAALKLKALLKDMYIRGRNDEKNKESEDA